jgi:hypothetical protein
MAPYVGKAPDVVVFADGTVLTPFVGSFATAPWTWPYTQGTVDPAAVQRLLDVAAELDLLTTSEPQPPRVDIADAPRTTIVIDTASGRFLHAVDALADTPSTNCCSRPK